MIFDEVFLDALESTNASNNIVPCENSDLLGNEEFDSTNLGENLSATYTTQPNVFGGVDIWNGQQRIGFTQPNVFGGQNFTLNSSHDDNSYDDKIDKMLIEDILKSNPLLEDVDFTNNPQFTDASGSNASSISSESILIKELDLDGDGETDLIVEEIDSNGDGIFDTKFTLALDEDGVHFESVDGIGYTYALHAENIETFNPLLSDNDNVVGEPARAMSLWEDQGETNRCGLYAQKFIIEEMTGQHIDIEQMVDTAEENGWFTEERGTSPLDMNKMLDYCGIDNEMSWDNDFNDLHNVLANGGRAIVAIDADEIWEGEEDGIFSPLDAANHAVEVAGIDYSDPDNPMVILNDSGNPETGRGSMIPVKKFMDAWADSGYQMVAV